MKFGILATLLLAFTLGCTHKAPAPQVKPQPIKTAIEQQHSTTHRIGVYDQFKGNPKNHQGEAGHCSGTAVGPHAVLTAQHCFHDSNLVRIDDEALPVEIVAALIDGNDHVIYIVRYDFKTWAEIDQRALVAKEPVHIWGAPGDNKDVYRIGYFREASPEKDIDDKFILQKFILPIYPGDSGAGIFDADGKVVAVITFGSRSAEELSEPLKFTDDQLDVATAQ